MIKEVHVEFACRDEVYVSLKKWANQNPQARLMLLADSCPRCFTALSPCDIRRRYEELSTTNPVGLHTHLFYPRHWWVESFTYEQQHIIIEKGLKTLGACNLKTTHFAPGNWKFNRDTVRACFELGLLDFHWYEYEDNKETVNWAKKHYKDVNFISAKGCYTHDWTIHYGDKVLVRV